MDNPGSPPPGKGSRWIVDEILAAFETTGGPAGSAARPAPVNIKELVAQALQEELERLEGEKPSPPAPLPQAGEG